MSETIVLETIDSTNNYIKQHFSSLKNFTIVRALEQTSGRGRRKNSWYSSGQKDLMFSMLYFIPEQVSNFNNITILIGLAVYRALNKLQKNTFQLKWPNDILANKKKIAGILCESVSKGDKNFAVLGVGVNINSIQFPNEIQSKTTSLKLILEDKSKADVTLVMNKIVFEVKNILSFFSDRISSELIQEWQSACGCIGSSLMIEGVEKGSIQKLNSDGSIQIKNQKQELENIYFY